jgi:hypothetical protein
LEISDGSRAIVGGPNDNDAIGSAWWLVLDAVDGIKQYKMIGDDCLAFGSAVNQGLSVAMNAAGTTFVVGGPLGGAVWTFKAVSDETTLTLEKLQDDIESIKHSEDAITLTLAKLQDDIEVLKRMIQLISPPSRSPSKKPTTKPSKASSRAPSKAPKTTKPSKSPSTASSKAPKTSKPSRNPSLTPTKKVVG